MPENKNFILLSYGRTGSTYLMKRLNQSANVNLASEIFHNNAKSRRRVNDQIWRDDMDSWEFVKKNLYDHPARQRVVGFKLFYFHAMGKSENSAIWDAVETSDDLDVVLLHRKNSFARFVSEMRARQSGVWHPKKDSSYSASVVIEIDVEQARKNILKARKHHERGHTLAKGKRSIEILYEDLEDDADAVAARLHDFLGLTGEISEFASFEKGSASGTRTDISNLEACRAMLKDIDEEWMITAFANP